MDTTALLQEIRNEQERQRHDLEAIKETLGVMGGRETIERLAANERNRRDYHDRRGMAKLKRYNAKRGRSEPTEKAQ